jgi:ATP-dependent helicase/nuclease subunit A
MAAGIAVHRLLESWDRQDDAMLEERLPLAVAAVSTEENVDAAQVEKEAREIVGAFRASPLLDQLRNLKVMGRELPILVAREDRTTVRGSIDLLYQEPDGQVVVADYKTDREDDNALLRDRYRDQLRLYAMAVEKALRLPSPPRTELWLLRHGKRCQA